VSEEPDSDGRPRSHGGSTTAGAPDPLGFAQMLLGLVDEGRRTATYKLAVLLALVDACAAGTDGEGRAAARISTRDLARHVTALYWPQVRPHDLAGAPSGVLRQSTQRRAVIVDAVADLRAAAAARGLTTLDLAERALSAEVERTLDTVEHVLVTMPLGKLQRPAGWTETSGVHYPRFLYDDSAFSEGVTPRQVRSAALVVELRPGVADTLVSLAGLLRPLLELHWTRAVARLNGTELGEDRLREFLFGTSRVSLQRLQPGLTELQAGQCFYCRRTLRRGAVEVDHVVPWSRVPNDALANLVLADRRCNGSKRDHPAALSLLERWAERPTAPLQQIADDAEWPLRLPESRAIARGVYAHLPPGTPVWLEPGVFQLLDRDRLAPVLRLLETP